MRVVEFSGASLRHLIAAIVTNDICCSKICEAAIRYKASFGHEAADVILNLCCAYYQQYSKAPKQAIQSLIDIWGSKESRQNLIEEVSTLLLQSAEEHKDYNDFDVTYITKIAEHYFNKTLAFKIADQIRETCLTGEPELAISKLEHVSKIKLSADTWIDPEEDVEAWIDAIESVDTAAIVYPGTMGELLGTSLSKGTLYSFWGTEKAGKSFFLIDAAWRAIMARKRVAFFEVGDLGKKEVLKRFCCRITRKPRKPGHVNWPVGWDGNNPVLEKRYMEEASFVSAINKLRRYSRGAKLLRISCHPNSSISVLDIKSYLDQWRRSEKWVPDVLIIDYADILLMKSPYKSSDTKDLIDETWKQLRRLSQEYDLLILTASQAGAQAYKKQEGSRMLKSDFSGRKTKLAHSNGVIGINLYERNPLTTYVNWVVRRDGPVMGQVCVAHCYEIAMPIVLSKWLDWSEFRGKET
ncbi:MAG: hypothetical protein KatS3mg087_1218 [Patescibacteria group bacterium]|nr:MAG: hypothetical protein KatS3mg087_1218 [Patescibacteria group bacterium]